MLILAAATAWAQVDNEKAAASVQKDGFGVALGAGGSSAAGNLSMFDIRAHARLQYRRSFVDEESETPWIRDLLIVDAGGSYLQLNGQPFLDNRLVSLGYTRMAVRRFGVELGAQYQNSAVLLLDARLTAAVATRVILVQSQRVQLNAGLGGLLEHEIRSVDPNGPDARRVTNPRLLGRVGWNVSVVPSAITWRHTFYAEPRIDRVEDHLIIDYNTLDAQITKALSTSCDLQLRYDSRPPSGVTPLDMRLTWGFTFRWAARPDDVRAPP